MRAFNDLVILEPKEDLERSWNSSTIITPDSVLTSAEDMVGFRHDHTAIAFVHRMPEDYVGTDLAVGDGVLLPLFSGSKVVCIDGKMYLACKRMAIAAKIIDLGKPSERIEALNGYVLTRQDVEAMQNRMNGGLILTDDYLDDGIPCDGGSDGIVRLVLERCVSVGSAYLSPSLQKPKQRKGELLGFNPFASCRFRRFAQKYRLTPNESIQFGLED
jgi:co-chaperonin GroES (HSP10)